jgi:hypothetical protein
MVDPARRHDASAALEGASDRRAPMPLASRRRILAAAALVGDRGVTMVDAVRAKGRP